MTQEQQRRDSFKGGLNPQKSVLGWSGAGVSDTEEGSGPEIIDLEETLMIRTVSAYHFSGHISKNKDYMYIYMTVSKCFILTIYIL